MSIDVNKLTKVLKVLAMGKEGVLDKYLASKNINWEKVYNNLQSGLYHESMADKLSGGQFKGNKRVEDFHKKKAKQYIDRLAKTFKTEVTPKLKTSKIGDALLKVYSKDLNAWLKQNCIESNIGKDIRDRIKFSKPV